VRLGDVARAERWTKVAERMAAAAQKLAEAPAPVEDWKEAEAIRAELRERFRRLVECDRANEVWERERDAHQRMCAQARKVGTPLPPPLSPTPFDDEQIQKITTGEDRNA
jgi:hypothetical protein